MLHISQFHWNLFRKISEMLAANHANLNTDADLNAAVTTLMLDHFCLSPKVKFLIYDILTVALSSAT